MPENVANRVCSSVTKVCHMDQDVAFNLKLSFRQLGLIFSWWLQMDGGLPMLNCLLQYTLRSLCSRSDSSNSSKWVYAVFWRILPRNYPPPKWDHGGSALDRSKGNKRNWILVWEDGFCDFFECERAGSGHIKGWFGADIFFKMSHEVYNFGEGLVGKIAADNSHKWVFKEATKESEPGFTSSWNASIDPQPKAWEFQFNSGIQTIAIISVREGIIQLGSFDKIVEDLNLVISVQRKFSNLQSIPGVFAIQRPYLPVHFPYTMKPNNHTVESQETALLEDKKCLLTGAKRLLHEIPEDSPLKSINIGWNSPQIGIAGAPIWSIPPLMPTMSCSLGALLSKLPSVIPSCYVNESPNASPMNNSSRINATCKRLKDDHSGVVSQVHVADRKVVCSRLLDDQEQKQEYINTNLQDMVVGELGFEPLREEDSALNIN